MEKNIEYYLCIASRLFSIENEDNIFEQDDVYIFTVNKNNILRLWNVGITKIKDVEIIHYGYFKVIYTPNDTIPHDLYEAWNKGQISLKHVSKSFYTRELNVRIFENKQYIECKLKTQYHDSQMFSYSLGQM